MSARALHADYGLPRPNTPQERALNNVLDPFEGIKSHEHQSNVLVFKKLP